MNRKKYTFYGLISQYRSEIMGIAIIWVIWFHSPLNIALPGDSLIVLVLNRTLEFFKNTGYGGVDLFLFISGMGIYNSLEKHTIAEYFKNRMKRIIPTWWFCLFFFAIPMLCLTNQTVSYSSIVGYATFTGYWFDMPNQGNWYVYAIFLLYLIAPVFVSFIKESDNKKQMTAILITILLFVSTAFWGKDYLLIFFSRIPAFVLGIYFSAEKQFREHTVCKRDWVMCIALFLFGITVLALCYFLFDQYLWRYGLWWYPFIVIAPTLSTLLGRLIGVFQNGIVLRTISVIGQSSLEILLVSGWIPEMLVFIQSRIFRRVLSILLSIVAGVLLRICIQKIEMVFICKKDS